MAFSLWQKLLFALIVAVIIVIIGQLIIIRTCNFQVAAVLFRIEIFTLIQTVMFMLSRFIIWRTFVPLIRQLPHLQLQQSSSSSTASQSSSERTLRKAKNSDTNLSAMNKDEFEDVTVRLGKVILFLYLLMCHVSYLTNLFLISADPHWISMLTYASLGSYTQLLTGLGMFKLLSLAISVCQKLRGRSNMLSYKYVAALALVYMIAASTVGLYTASQPPPVKNVTVQVKDLPSSLEGLSIVQLCDIHLGPTVGRSRLTRIVEIVNTENPDVVVVTGDLVDASVEHLKEAAEPLKDIRSLHGKFFVTGNHEYYTGDVDNWFVYLRSLGFTILHNSNVKISSADGHGHICLAGTDDIQSDRMRYDGHTFDLDRAVGSCSSDTPVILLAHQPHAAKMALDSKYRIDLVLSGHTHGGQMFPWIIGAYFLNPFFVGLYQYGHRGSQVYVSQGTQYWGMPMRIATSMEITRITLFKAA